MSNSFFHFKQFTIHQDKCAMKVSTDACIQGAWTPIDPGVSNVLDIGTGTGLLSLMSMQRNNALHIDAVEQDADAALQAKENVSRSSWTNSVGVIQADARYYDYDKKYDMVICNPPFFQNSLLGPDVKRNDVRHTLSLSYTDLFAIIENVLKPIGYASVLLPVAEHAIWEEIVHRKGWHINRMLKIKPRQELPYNRIVSICSQAVGQPDEESICIYESIGVYTEPFKALMSDFYQKL